MSSLSVAQPAALSAEAPSVMDLNWAMEYREMLGLETDPSHVRRLEADATASRRYGVALTLSEAEELDNRGRIHSELEPILRFLDGIPDRSGGLFIDQRAAGRVVVNLVGGTEADKSHVAALLPDGAQLEFREVASTLAELRALHRRVDATVPALRAAGIVINLVSTIVADNAVLIGIDELRPDWISQIAQQFPTVRVVQQDRISPGACSRSVCLSPEPLRAGIAITGNNRTCTSGVLVHSGTNTKMLSAGHCFREAADFTPRVGIVVTQAGQTIGSVTEDTYYDGSDADAMVIDILNSRESNWIFTTYAVTNQGFAVEGMNLCRSGIVSLGDCGIVEALYDTTSYDVAPISFVKQIRVGFGSAKGDSGSPLYLLSPGRAYGIFASFTATDSWFGDMNEILINFNEDLCVTFAC